MKIQPVELGEDRSVEAAGKLAADHPIVDPEIYDAERSCLDHINHLSDPEVEVTDEEITNLVIKYFYHWLFGLPLEDEKAPSLDIVSTSFHHAHAFMDRWRESLKKGELRHDDLGRIEQFIGMQVAHRGYSIALTGDVAATSVCVREIVKRTIEPREEFVGVGLGAGSGILDIIAQHIMAKRNGVESPLIIPVEGNVMGSQKLMEVMGPLVGFVLNGNTAEDLVHQFCPDRIDFLVNENVPMCRVNLGDREPLLTNLRQLSTRLSQDHIPSFPAKVHAVMQPLEPEGEEKGAVFNLEDMRSWRNYHDELNEVLSVQALEIGGEMVPQHEIGGKLKCADKITQLSRWYPRWATPSS